MPLIVDIEWMEDLATKDYCVRWLQSNRVGIAVDEQLVYPALSVGVILERSEYATVEEESRLCYSVSPVYTPIAPYAWFFDASFYYQSERKKGYLPGISVSLNKGSVGNRWSDFSLYGLPTVSDALMILFGLSGYGHLRILEIVEGNERNVILFKFIPQLLL